MSSTPSSRIDLICGRMYSLSSGNFLVGGFRMLCLHQLSECTLVWVITYWQG